MTRKPRRKRKQGPNAFIRPPPWRSPQHHSHRAHRRRHEGRPGAVAQFLRRATVGIGRLQRSAPRRGFAAQRTHLRRTHGSSARRPPARISSVLAHVDPSAAAARGQSQRHLCLRLLPARRIRQFVGHGHGWSVEPCGAHLSTPSAAPAAALQFDVAADLGADAYHAGVATAHLADQLDALIVVAKIRLSFPPPVSLSLCLVLTGSRYFSMFIRVVSFVIFECCT